MFDTIHPKIAWSRVRRGRGVMRSWLTSRLLVALSLASVALPANAILLTYTGNNFTFTGVQGSLTPPDVHTTSDNVTVSLELAGALAANLADALVSPLAFTVSDGVSTLTQDNSTDSLFRFTTDALGQIIEWHVTAFLVELSDPARVRQIETSFVPGSVYDVGLDLQCGPGSTGQTGCSTGSGLPWYQTFGLVQDSPGTWSYVAVAEPASLGLFLTGLFVLVLGRRRTAA